MGTCCSKQGGKQGEWSSPVLKGLSFKLRSSTLKIRSSQDQTKVAMSTDGNRKPHPKNKFTVEEDILLRKLVAQYGENNWQQVARRMEGRNLRQCKERWNNYLTPMVRNTPWTPEEDELLLNKVAEIGPHWVRISKYFPMRTDINIKNRYLVLKRRNKKEADLPPPPAITDPCSFLTRPEPVLRLDGGPIPIPPLIVKKPMIPLKKLGVIEISRTPPPQPPAPPTMRTQVTTVTTVDLQKSLKT